VICLAKEDAITGDAGHHAAGYAPNQKAAKHDARMRLVNAVGQ
jgi:hypothetical protein